MKLTQSPHVFFSLLTLFVSACSAWDNEELEMFDLVEEVNMNFYELLGVDQTAKTSEIRKAYRRLSLQLHPDKNSAADAEEKFRQMVAVYEVLKDENRRKQYEEVLVNGLPDWKMPVFYYRRVRKMGMLELSLLLFVILTVGHYLVVWSIYLEKKFTMEELFSEVRKKKEKKARKNKTDVSEEMDELLKEELGQLPRPELRNILPFQCIRFTVHVIVSLPTYCSMGKAYLIERRERQKEEAREKEEEEAEVIDVVKKPKIRRKVELPEFTDDQYEKSNNVVVYSPIDDSKQEEAKQIIKTGEWTDEEIGLLAKAVAKFPGGTAKRWEKVAEMMGRTPSEVISKSKSFKGSYLLTIDPKAQGLTGAADTPITFKGGRSLTDDITIQSANQDDLNSNNVSNQKKMILKPDQSQTSKADSKTRQSGSASDLKNSQNDQSQSKSGDNDCWTQNQQMIFEWALKQNPKGTELRWEKVAEHIPGKTKEDCMCRFKYLAEMVRKRKAAAS